ncbi:MAG TPA: heavy metal-associated domain-containing protein [Steroidobacteraceae bacterium]|nr:heavy metal-associated domain-containing protein [Steroidobacteraceae bacterium]
MSETDTGEREAGSAGIELAISGMACAGCASTLTRVLASVPGVARAQVELASGRARIEGGARIEDLLRAVEAAGYEAKLAGSDAA